MKIGILICIVMGLVALCVVFFVHGCRSNVLLGNVQKGLAPVPGDFKAGISPERAVELAREHLERSYELRRMKRQEKSPNPNREPLDWVSLKGDWYYIARDDYPSYSPGFYMHNAVKVHKNTGQVIPPEQ